ncbi:MAG: hypothetical protein HN719_09075, partial [Alphaproteobacteria bacterium]|nr:hypothetical protein [Alphaproteobacteria bacterium]
DDLNYWTADYSVWFKKALRHIERDVPRSVWWFFGYPFVATFDSLPVFEARRIGFGPFGILVLPFAVLGAWTLRERMRQSRLFIFAVVCALFYALWFFTGSSQRVRHLVPVLPLFLVVVTVAAVRFADIKKTRAPLEAAVGLALMVQLAGHGIFGLAPLKYLTGNDSREAFLSRNVLVFEPVPWINANLTSKDRLFLNERQILYYLKVPYFFGTPHIQARVELRQGRVRPKTLYRQLKSVGVTHVLYRFGTKPGHNIEQAPWLALRKMGCLTPQKKFQIRHYISRTLPGLKSALEEAEVLKLNERKCLG